MYNKIYGNNINWLGFYNMSYLDGLVVDNYMNLFIENLWCKYIKDYSIFAGVKIYCSYREVRIRVFLGTYVGEVREKKSGRRIKVLDFVNKITINKAVINKVDCISVMDRLNIYKTKLHLLRRIMLLVEGIYYSDSKEVILEKEVRKVLFIFLVTGDILSMLKRLELESGFRSIVHMCKEYLLS